VRTVPDEFCDVEIFYDESPEMADLACLEEKGHPENIPHKALVFVPCMECGGIDYHYEWCQSDATETRYMKLLFTTDGWYWCEGVL